MADNPVISISWHDDRGWRAECAHMPELCLSAPTLGELLVNMRAGIDLMAENAIARAVEAPGGKR